MNIDVNNYTYYLPPDRIAKHPLPERDESKLLVYEDGKIAHRKFADLAAFLPHSSTLFFNDTKVIAARLLFQKSSGAIIEIFLLNPLEPFPLLVDALQTKETCRWKCTIGNLKRWNNNTLSKTVGDTILQARLVDRHAGIVEFSWNGGKTFGEIVQGIGDTPLPPYLNRPPDVLDKERYQTVYSNSEGAVAAPTAGLHFTPAVFASINEKCIKTDFLTLHVSAGTFQPIKVKDAFQHVMHQEQIVVSRQNIKTILESVHIIAVGTTSMRTLESLYWFGAMLIQDPNSEFNIDQRYPYTHPDGPQCSEALNAVLNYMDINKKEKITGTTSIYIVPGYKFRLCRGLITNFHQPSSTLILLVAAFIGDDWKKVYEEALVNEYRFLSYGDSSLLLP